MFILFFRAWQTSFVDTDSISFHFTSSFLAILTTYFWVQFPFLPSVKSVFLNARLDRFNLWVEPNYGEKWNIFSNRKTSNEMAYPMPRITNALLKLERDSRFKSLSRWLSSSIHLRGLGTMSECHFSSKPASFNRSILFRYSKKKVILIDFHILEID